MARATWRLLFDKRQLVPLAAMVSAVVGATDCSVLVDLNATQCSTDADCTALGGDFANTKCENSVCVSKSRPMPNGCTSNKACSDASGAPAICNKDTGDCVPLLTDTCPKVYGLNQDGSIDDNAVILGMVFTLTGSEQKYGQRAFLALTLAYEEIRKQANGLPPIAPGSPRRPIAMVACDDAAVGVPNGEDIQNRSVEHLIKDVGVPLIHGYSYSTITIRLATTYDIPAGVMVMCSHCTAPALVDLPDKGLVWTCDVNDADEATPLAHMVDVVEPMVRKEQNIAAATPIRLMVVSSDGPTYSPVADLYQEQVKFNGGKTAVENGTNYQRFDYLNPQDNPMPNYPEAIGAVIAFKPQIVQLLGTTEVANPIMEGIEAGWPASVPKPHYVFGHDQYGGGNILDAVNAADMGTGTVYPRVHGVYYPPPDLTLYNDFKLRYQAAYPGEQLTIQANHYDAAYAVAYAIAAAGNVPKLTGAAIASAMSKLVPPGQPIDVGPSHINEAFTALAAGGNIDLNGTTGPLDWNLSTGIPPGQAAAWCIAPGSTGALAFSPNTGLNYDAFTQTYSGTYACTPPSP